MIALLLAAAAATGVHLLFSTATATADGPGPDAPATNRRRVTMQTWLHQAGLEDVNRHEFGLAVLSLFAIVTTLGYAALGTVSAALVVGGFAASFPFVSYRHRRQLRRATAQEAWPRLIEEIRVQTSSLGRSIPHALFEVGARGPAELRPAFAEAHREWLLTTDLARTFSVLKRRLGDPTADITCETLLVAHELGGTDLARRLDALAEDRRSDVQGRKDARSRQAGARFARLFVLFVPAGMALAGTSIGNGREAYRTSTGQVIVVAALGLVIACWVWAGRVMRLPDPERVFDE